MNTNMAGFKWFSKIFLSLCFGRKRPQALEGLTLVALNSLTAIVPIRITLKMGTFVSALADW